MQEDDNADNTTVAGACHLPPAYRTVLASGNDDEAVLQKVLEESKADEDVVFPVLHYAMDLKGLVPEHIASRPPPACCLRMQCPRRRKTGNRCLRLPAPPRRRRHDHPHGVVIDPLAAPEVVVLDDDDM
jgi:hypothetical protein